jgi:hypothetical protein
MKRVIVVGAGATFAEASPSVPNRSKEPPLDATFFRLARAARMPELRAVRDYVSARFGVDPADGDHGMEEVFNLIHSDSFGDALPAGCLDAYWALLRLYARAIAETTNRLQGTSRYGVGRLLRDFYLRASDPEMSFVTFNQDLVIEKAIESARHTQRYQSIPWSLGAAYGIPFKDMHPVDPRWSFRDVQGEPSIPIHKLHGSLNWLFTVRSGSDPKNSIRKPTSALHCLNSSEILDDLRYITRGKQRTKSQDVVPLIVPPISEKGSTFGQAVAPVWRNAASDLASCDSLVFFGYSLPPADVWASAMLRAAIHANQNLSEVCVIDPSSTSAARIRDVIGNRPMHQYPNVPSFLE